jgi:hypothetical protein
MHPAGPVYRRPGLWPDGLLGQAVRVRLIGVLVYLIARGGSMHERAAGRAQR